MTERDVFNAKTKELRRTNIQISSFAKRARRCVAYWPPELLAKMNLEIDSHLRHSRTLEENLKTISSRR